VAGSQNLSFEEAEALKTRPEEQARLFPSLRPVMEKVASIILRTVKGRSVPSIVLVGGASAFPNMAEVVEEYTHIPTWVPPNPVFVTPVGIAMYDQPQ
jgi:ethanolamine utilization protein EutJ